MADRIDLAEELFDQWPDRYDDWFETPIGKLVKKYETALLLEMLSPLSGERILDVGCGTGIFTRDVLSLEVEVTGLDLSLPMLKQAIRKISGNTFNGLVGDMKSLPFSDGTFDKVFSMTAIEFLGDAKEAVKELGRVTKKNGTIVLTTLNSLSPWAARRMEEGKKGHSLFKNMHFRSPSELADLVGTQSRVKTAIHFLKEDEPKEAEKKEKEGTYAGKDTGAFVALAWINS